MTSFVSERLCLVLLCPIPPPPRGPDTSLLCVWSFSKQDARGALQVLNILPRFVSQYQSSPSYFLKEAHCEAGKEREIHYLLWLRVPRGVICVFRALINLSAVCLFVCAAVRSPRATASQRYGGTPSSRCTA